MMPIRIASNSLRHSLARSTSVTINHRAAGALTAPSLAMITDRMSFSTTPSKKKKKAEKEVELSYAERKRAAKEARRVEYQEKMERRERRKHRRDGRNRGVMREAFRAFWEPRFVREEKWNRYARREGLDWKMNVAVIFERQNVLLPEMAQWEKDYVELEKVLRETTGKDYPDYFLYDPDSEGSAEGRKRIPDFMEFPEKRVYETEADKSGSTRTIDRKLDKFVFLMIKENDSENWQLPKVALEEDEMLPQAAFRALDSQIGSSIERFCLSYAPMGVDVVPLPEEERKESGFYGTKTFFMRVNHFEGDVVDAELNAKDFAWLTREEVTAVMQEQHGDEVGKFYHYLM